MSKMKVCIRTVCVYTVYTCTGAFVLQAVYNSTELVYGKDSVITGAILDAEIMKARQALKMEGTCTYINIHITLMYTIGICKGIYM